MNVNTGTFCAVFCRESRRLLEKLAIGREGGSGRAREEGRERAELFQRPGRLSLHEVNAAGGRLDGNEWYASLGVTTVVGAAACLQAPTHSLVSSRRCWRHTRHFFWDLKASLTLCLVIFFLTERFSCVYVLSIFPAIVTAVANETGNSFADRWWKSEVRHKAAVQSQLTGKLSLS